LVFGLDGELVEEEFAEDYQIDTYEEDEEDE
jgi:hypothetical protein